MNKLETWRIWDTHDGVFVATCQAAEVPDGAKLIEADDAAWLVDTWFPDRFNDGHAHGALRAIYTTLERRGARGPLEPMPHPSKVRDALRDALRRGALIAYRVTPELTVGDILPAMLPDTPPPAPDKEKIRDLIVFCQHEIDGRQRTAHTGDGLFEVVSDPKELKDKITILYRDDFTPPPDQIDVSWNQGGMKVSKKGVEGDGYSNYTFNADYKGKKTDNILSGEFWSRLNQGTRYTVSGIAESIAIVHYVPHKWRLEIAMPAMRGLKVGSKLEQSAMSASGPGFAMAAQEKTFTLEVKDNGWTQKGTSSSTTATASSSQMVMATPSSAIAGSAHSLSLEHEEKAQSRGPDIIKLTRDGARVTNETLDGFLSIIEVAVGIYNIIRTIQDHAPKVGWYAEFDLQIFQGTFVVEWAWKEFDDHRAYLWLSTGIEITFFSVALELGVGLSACGFKAQLYAQLKGSVGLNVKVERTSPDGVDQLQLPFESKITGALGVRFEAGNWVQIDGHGETSLGFNGDLTVNIRRGVSSQGAITWSGITASYTFSVKRGLFGYDRSGSATLINSSQLGTWDFPQEKPYNPEYTNRDRIKNIVKNKLTEGWDIRVFTPSDAWYKSDTKWDIDDLAERLAAKIDARKDIRRDAKSIEGLAHDIRQRLDDMGRRWGRDYIEAARFESFVNGELDAMMSATYIDPARDLLNRAGGSTSS